MTSIVKHSLPLVLLPLLALAGCSHEGAESRQAIRDITPEILAWNAHSAQPISATSIKLRDGQCLDTTRLPQPWVAVADPNTRRLGMAAPGHEIGMDPYEVRGRDSDFNGNPYDGRVRVAVSGWSRPSDDLGIWPIAAPATIDEQIRSGYFKRIKPWPENELGLEAYEASSRPIYVDARRFTQCEQKGNDEILCIAVAADEQFMLAVHLSVTNSDTLPSILGRLLATAESIRGSCT